MSPWFLLFWDRTPVSGAWDLGFVLRCAVGSPHADFAAWQMQKQRSELAQQDEHLDILLESVKRIGLTSKHIADELQEQKVYACVAF